MHRRTTTLPLLFLSLLASLSLLSSCAAEQRAEWQVVNYWATWCGPCRDEIPELNELAKLQPERLQVLGVNYDAPGEPEASEHIAEMGIEFANISLERAEAMGLLYPSTLPTTYVLHNGEIVKMLRGPQTLETLLAVTDVTHTEQ